MGSSGGPMDFDYYKFHYSHKGNKSLTWFENSYTIPPYQASGPREDVDNLGGGESDRATLRSQLDVWSSKCTTKRITITNRRKVFPTRGGLFNISTLFMC